MAVKKNGDGTVTRVGGGRPGGTAKPAAKPGTSPGFPTDPGGRAVKPNPKGTVAK